MTTLGNTRIPIIQFDLPKDGGTISHLKTYDSSSIKNFMQCGRGYLFRNIIGLREDEPNVHLEFGKAWAHASYQMRLHMDQTGFASYPAIPTQLHAIAAFQESWNATYLEEDTFGITLNEDEIKNLITGLAAIQQYAQKYLKEDFKVLEAEKLFGTLIDDKNIIWGHKDGIIEDEFGIWGVEDKTAQFIDWRRAPLKMDVWPRMWDTNFQVGCYAFDGYQKYGPDFQGMIINGLHLRKKSAKDMEEEPSIPVKFEFVRIHSPRSYDQLVYWQDQARHWVSMIDLNLDILSDKSSSSQTLGACFPPNGEYCSHYGCQFEGLCTLANPLQHIERWTNGNPPAGFEICHWNPIAEKESVVEVKRDEVII